MPLCNQLIDLYVGRTLPVGGGVQAHFPPEIQRVYWVAYVALCIDIGTRDRKIIETSNHCSKSSQFGNNGIEIGHVQVNTIE